MREVIHITWLLPRRKKDHELGRTDHVRCVGEGDGPHEEAGGNAGSAQGLLDQRVQQPSHPGKV